MIERLEEPCPGCHARNRVGSNFCAQCGLRLAPAPPLPAEPARRAGLRPFRDLADTALVVRRSLRSPIARRLLQTTFTVGLAAGLALPPVLRLAGRGALGAGLAQLARLMPPAPAGRKALPPARERPDSAPDGEVIVHVVQLREVIRRFGVARRGEGASLPPGRED